MIRSKTTVGLFLTFLAFSLSASALQAQSCPSLVWADEFDGISLDTSLWSYQIGDGCSEGICGWGNNEEQSYQEANVTVGGGLLMIEAREQRIRNKRYTSGRIRTLNKGEWFTGRFEARIKMTQGQGIWPAFWMLPTDEVFGGWPSSGEIDIMENIGSQLDTVTGTIHYGGSPQTAQSSGTSFRLNAGIFADDFHEFAIEKEAGVIRWMVDDVLYFTRTPDDIAPENWPFDERFHLLLNVAVGGNYPGSPDATTQFPQVLEVDYVRVYDANLPHIAGDRVVAHQASGVVYTVGNASAGSSFNWTVPAGATIASGQGTSSITVDWGSTGGDVTADVSSSCGNELLTINVEVEPPFVFDFSFENFDDPPNVTFDFATGTLVEVDNPDSTGINTSARSGEYTRNPAEQFDVLFYDVSVINDASEYVTNQRKFYLDVFTAAPVGSEILLQLEDSSSATAEFPIGRHSRYQAFTSVTGQWERLVFSFLDRPDASTPDTAIDDIVLLFAPNTSSADTYTFDNFDSYVVDSGITPPAAPSNLAATAVSTSQIDLAWVDNSTDEDGFEIERSTDGVSFALIDSVGVDETAYSDTGLAASTTYYYQVRAFNGGGDSDYSNIDSATTQGGTATTMHVESITPGTQNAGQGNKRGAATVTIFDNLGNAVSGATVSGTFSGDFSETVGGATGADGSVVLVTTGVKKGKISFTFCVTGVTHGSLTYDSGANVESCDSL